MNKKVLFEFLKSKVICDEEIFPSEVGISRGNTLSPLIGNLVLDGLQRELYEVQRKSTLLLHQNAKVELITLQFGRNMALQKDGRVVVAWIYNFG